MCTNSHSELRTNLKMPARPQHNSPVTDDQIAVISAATIDPVVEINREVRALGITWATHCNR
jgi:hypothetical protein